MHIWSEDIIDVRFYPNSKLRTLVVSGAAPTHLMTCLDMLLDQALGLRLAVEGPFRSKLSPFRACLYSYR